MANIPSQTKPVFQTADVPAGPTVTPASEIPKPKTIIKENQMHYSSIKEAYLYGFKDGVSIGMEKGIEISENWNEDCPPANTSPIVEGISYEETQS